MSREAFARSAAAAAGSAFSLLAVNVLAHGAKGDGTSNDAGAIAKAIAAAEAATFKQVGFPAGNYLIASTLSSASTDVEFVGSGNAIITYASEARAALELASGARRMKVRGLSFVGNASNDLAVNLYPAIQMNDDVIDVDVEGCYFDQCLPLQANDSAKSKRLRFVGNYVHNAPNGLHPPSYSVIDGNWFVCDSVVDTRAQAIYCFGRQTNLTITNNLFQNIANESIQIRSSSARFQRRHTFKIQGNTFEGCAHYGIWIGSDDHPDIGEAIITGNTFRNVNGCIMAQGLRSGIVAHNHCHFDWEWPHALPGANAIQVSGAPGLPGHYNTTRGVVVDDNKVFIHDPWVGKVTLDPDALPVDGTELVVGLFTYTWRDAAAVEGDIQIGATVNESAENLRKTIAGLDGRMTAPCNVLRYVTDVFCNQYATTYGETDGNVVVIVSWSDFTLTTTGTATIDAPEDYRQAASSPLGVNLCIAPLVTSNHLEDCAGGISAVQNVEPTFYDNTFTGQASSLAPFACYGNTRSRYRGNRLIELQRIVQGQSFYCQISDAFPIIEDDWIVNQQLTNAELCGRSGCSPVGDGKGYAYFYYGMELNTAVQDATTRPYRWDDGDTLQMWQGGAFLNYKFKRTAPNAGAREFNSADGLIALINADGVFVASYASFTNDLAAADPKLMLKFKLAAAGAVNAAWYFQLLRFKDPAGVPGDPVTTVPQPLLTGIFLRNPQDALDPEKGRFYGGAATATQTFVHTPLAHKNRPVFVQGADAASRALNPYVDQADIVPGVGFLIRHDVAAGTEAGWLWRVG